MSQFPFDERMVRRLETMYRSRDVLRRRRLVQHALGARPGERILDVGCGPGFYVAEILEQVGPEGSVVGVDQSPQMLGVATRRCEPYPNVAFHQADATSLPVGDEDFDAALSVQVLEYVDDVTAALRELHRALRPGGRLVVWDVDWATVSLHSSDPARTERALRAWDEHLAHPALPQTLAARLRSAGFDDVRAEGHSFVTTALVPDTYGGAIVPMVSRFVAGRQGIDEDEAKQWLADLDRLNERGEFYFACIQCCFTARRPG